MNEFRPRPTGGEFAPQVVTVSELAQYLRLDRKSIYAAIHSGQMPGARRFGRTWRVSLAAVAAWLAAGERFVAEEPESVECLQI